MMGIESDILSKSERAYIGELHSGTTYDDSSSNSADRTFPQGVSWVYDENLRRWVVEFTGATGINVSPLPAFGSRIGGAVWVKATSGTQEQRVFGFNEAENPPFHLLRVGFPDSSSAQMFVSSNTVNAGSLTVTDWTHYGWIAMASGQLEFFVNGASVGTSSVGSFSNGAAIGAHVGSSRHGNQYPLTGRVADLILSSQITAEEIAWLADPSSSLLSGDHSSLRITARIRSRLSLRL